MSPLHHVLLAGLATAAAQSTESNSSTVNPCEACPGGVCGNCELVPVRAVVVTPRNNDGAARFWWFLFFLVIPVALLALCLYSCMSTASRRKSMQQQQGVAGRCGVEHHQAVFPPGHSPGEGVEHGDLFRAGRAQVFLQ